MDDDDEAKDSASIPSTVYHYLQIASSHQQHYAYKMCGVSQANHQRVLEYRTGQIQNISSAAAQHFEQIKLFNDIFIQEGNALSLQLMFHTLSNGCFLCSPTSYGTLRILVHDKDALWQGAQGHGLRQPPSTCREEDEEEDNTYMACSTYTIFHDYVQRRNVDGGGESYFHVGISFVPSGVLFVPVLLDDRRLGKLLEDWKSKYLPKAKRESIITFRRLLGEPFARYVLPRMDQKNLLQPGLC
jgi:hypothetical protein